MIKLYNFFFIAKGCLSEDTIRMLLLQLAGAMSVLRSKGIIHRDLKPQNILLSYSTGRRANPNNICIKLGECSGSKYTVSTKRNTKTGHGSVCTDYETVRL